jgi:hypothetical protein
MSWVKSKPTIERMEIKFQPDKLNFTARYSQGLFSPQTPPPPQSKMKDCLFVKLKSNHLLGEKKSFLIIILFLHVMPCSLVKCINALEEPATCGVCVCVCACVSGSKGPDTNTVGDQTAAE